MVSTKAAFLIVAAGLTLHLPVFQLLLILLGYTAFDNLDNWLAKRAQQEKIARVLNDDSDWQTSPDDPQYEVRPGWERVKLPQHEQIVVTRLAQIFARMYVS